MVLKENLNRASRADEAISRYGDDVSESNVIDLLTDAMHWCDQYGEDSARMLAHAFQHYLSESAGDADQARRLL
jgi:hypothetical protein